MTSWNWFGCVYMYYLNGTPGRVGEKVNGTDVTVVNIEAQEEIQLPHINLLIHQ